jgi:hypothetical protein
MTAGPPAGRALTPAGEPLLYNPRREECQTP